MLILNARKEMTYLRIKKKPSKSKIDSNSPAKKLGICRNWTQHILSYHVLRGNCLVQ